MAIGRRSTCHLNVGVVEDRSSMVESWSVASDEGGRSRIRDGAVSRRPGGEDLLAAGRRGGRELAPLPVVLRQACIRPTVGGLSGAVEYRPSGRGRRRRRLVASGLLVAWAVAACSSSGAKPAEARPPSTTSSTAASQVEATIASLWQNAEAAWVTAARNPAASAPNLLLDDYYADPELSFLKQQLAARKRDGLFSRGDIDEVQTHVVGAGRSQATVVACEVNHLQLLRPNGQPFPGTAGDPTPTPDVARATVVLTPSGVWKVSSVTVKAGPCVSV
jgi:hypothetical protein